MMSQLHYSNDGRGFGGTGVKDDGRFLWPEYVPTGYFDGVSRSIWRGREIELVTSV